MNNPLADLREKDISRLWSKILVSDDPSDCWEWVGRVDKDGYGLFTLGRSPRQAHRVSWAASNGPIPNDLLVLHRCDNPRCCNPGHLWLGTNADNMADKISKGRGAGGERCAMHGVRNGNAKLTEASISAILDSLEVGESRAVIAERHGVHPGHVWRIGKGDHWALRKGGPK